MKVIDIKNYVEHYDKLIHHLEEAGVFAEPTYQAIFATEQEQRHYQSLKDFRLDDLNFLDKANDQEISLDQFLDFILTTDRLASIAPGPCRSEQFLRIWLEESLTTQPSLMTFMHTPIDSLALNDIIFLDGRYESVEEILLSMESNRTNGKNIYLNPNTTPSTPFSLAAITKLQQHPALITCIEQYQARQQLLANIALPEAFYDALHIYLSRLEAIGHARGGPWAFPEESLDECLQAKITFFATTKSVCSEEQFQALTVKSISAQLHQGPRCDALFMNVAEGRDEFECIISQQIYLWSMLRTKRQELETPMVLAQHRQGRLYQLRSDTMDADAVLLGENPGNLGTLALLLAQMNFTTLLEQPPVSTWQSAQFSHGLAEFLQPPQTARELELEALFIAIAFGQQQRPFH